MNTRRIVLATIVGALCGLFCAYGTSTMENPGFPVTTGLLVSIFYNRLLIGLFVGIGDNIRLHAVPRGALIGAVITMAMSIIPFMDGRPNGGMILLVFGIIYGIIADAVATRFSQ